MCNMAATNSFVGEEEEIDLQCEDDTLRYFKPLMSKEVAERAQFMDNLHKSVRLWVGRSDQDIAAQRLLEHHLPTVLRLSVTCPFKDVRARLSDMLSQLQSEGISVPRPRFSGASSFIALDEIVCYQDNELQPEPEIQGLFEKAFVRDARLSHMVTCLGHHSRYLDHFVKTLDFLMNGNGPLRQDIRSFVAILAASRHKCSYLVTYQEMEFVSKGGDRAWLQGVTDDLPVKVRNLLHLNKMLCHQPWNVNEQYFKDLLIGPDSWSVAELAHALLIMCVFHSLAGFCLGCGINPEIDTPLGYVMTDQSNAGIPQCTNPALGMGSNHGSDSELTDSSMSPTCSPPSTDGSKYLVKHFIETSQDNEEKKLADTIKENLAAVSSDDDELPEELGDQQFAESVSSRGMEKPPVIVVPTPINVAKYLDDPAYEHEDFTLTCAVTLRAREYSWDDHGFPFLASLYPTISELLDDKFTTAYEMTYRQIGKDKDIDTKKFRQATWYYIQSIKGIRHDDYNYGLVNKVLSITYKTYIRMVSCFPERVTKMDFVNNTSGLEYSEKIHVNILVMEARLQAELIYALKALMKHMK